MDSGGHPSLFDGADLGQPQVPEASTDDHHGRTLHLPSPRDMVRHALPALVEGTIGPAVVFYLALVIGGFRGALFTALAWSYVALARRVVCRQRIPGVLLLGVTLISFRTVIGLVTGSPFLYFVQPAIGTFLVGALFLTSVIVRRPLAQRLAQDFCPLDPDLIARPYIRTFFLRISLLWCVVLMTNAAVVTSLLIVSSLGAFVVERTLVSTLLTVGGILLSAIWFVRVMRRGGVEVRWGRGKGAPVPS